MTEPVLSTRNTQDTVVGYSLSESDSEPTETIVLEGSSGNRFDVSEFRQCTDASETSSEHRHSVQIEKYHLGDEQSDQDKDDNHVTNESCTQAHKQYQCMDEQPVTQIANQKTVAALYQFYQTTIDQTIVMNNAESLLSFVKSYQNVNGDEPEYRVLLHCVHQKLDCDYDGAAIIRLMLEHPLTTCICMLILDHETCEFPQHKLLDTLVELTKSDLSLLEPWYKHPLFRNVLDCLKAIDLELTKDPRQTVKLLIQIDSKTAPMTLHLGDNLNQDELASSGAVYDSELEESTYKKIDKGELERELEIKGDSSIRVILDGMKAIEIVVKRLEHKDSFKITFHLLMDVQNKYVGGKGTYLIGAFGRVAIMCLNKFDDKLDVKNYSMLLSMIDKAISQWQSEYADKLTRARCWMQQQLSDLKDDKQSNHYKTLKKQCSNHLPPLTQDRVEFVSIFNSYRDAGLHDFSGVKKNVFEFAKKIRSCGNAEERLALVRKNLENLEIPFTGFIYALGDMSEITSPGSQLKIIEAYNDLLMKYKLEEAAVDLSFFANFISVIKLTEKFIRKNKTKDIAALYLTNQKMKNCLWQKSPSETNGLLHERVKVSSEMVLNASFCAVGENADNEMYIGLSNEVAYMFKTKRYSQLSPKQKNDVERLLIQTTDSRDKVLRSMFKQLQKVDSKDYRSESLKELTEELQKTGSPERLKSLWFGITAGLLTLESARKIVKRSNFPSIIDSLFASLISACSTELVFSNDDESYSQLESAAARAYPYAQCRLVDWHIKHPDSNQISRETCYRYIMTPSLLTTDEKKLYQGIVLMIGLGGDKDITQGKKIIKPILLKSSSSSNSCLLIARLLLTNEVMDGELLLENKEKLIDMFIAKYIKTKEQSSIAVSLLLSKEERKVLFVLLKSVKGKKQRSTVENIISEMDEPQLPSIDCRVKASTANPSKISATDKASEQVDNFLRLTEPPTDLQVNELVKALQALLKLQLKVFPHFEVSRIPDVVKVIPIRSDTISVLTKLIGAIKGEKEKIQILKEVLLSECNAENIKSLGIQCSELIEMLPASVIIDEESQSVSILAEISFKLIGSQFVEVLFEPKNLAYTQRLLSKPDEISPVDFPDVFTRYFRQDGVKLEAVANKIWNDKRCNDINLLKLSFSSLSSVSKHPTMSGELIRNELLIGRTAFSAKDKYYFFQQLSLEEKRSMLENHKNDFFLAAANNGSLLASNDSSTLAAHILQQCKTISDVSARKAENIVNKNHQHFINKSFEYTYGFYQLFLEHKINKPEILLAILCQKAKQVTGQIWTGDIDQLYAECFLMTHKNAE